MNILSWGCLHGAARWAGQEEWVEFSLFRGSQSFTQCLGTDCAVVVPWSNAAVDQAYGDDDDEEEDVEAEEKKKRGECFYDTYSRTPWRALKGSLHDTGPF